MPENLPGRALVLCADDFALSPEVSQGIAALAAAGRISATSAMVLSPRWSRDAALLAPHRSRIDVGLHLDWTSDFALQAGHGKPLGALMAQSATGQLRHISERIRGVIEQQLDAFEHIWQARPDHIDGHQHIHQFSGIRQVLLQVIEQRYAPGERPYLRLSRPPTGQRSIKSCIVTLWGGQRLGHAARQRRIPCAAALTGFYNFTGSLSDYARHMQHWVQASPAGTLLMCHPAGGLNPADPISPARWTEFQYLMGAEFAHLLQTEQVYLARGASLYQASL